MAKEIKRIVVFNVNWVGDVLFSTAVIRNLRYHYPRAFISCIVPSACYQVLKGNPYLDEILIFDEHDRHRSLVAKLQFVQLLRRKRFDLVVLLHRSFTRALLCALAGIPQRVGYSTPKRGFLLTRRIMPPQVHSLHRIDYYLGVLAGAGMRPEDRYPEFFVSDEDKALVHQFLEKQGVGRKDFLVGLNPGGNWLPKRWPLSHWATLAAGLVKDCGAKVIVVGAQKDQGLAAALLKQAQVPVSMAAGVFNLKQLAALAQRLDVFITADTGPLHIANAVGTRRIIALFGPTDVRITGPVPEKNVTILQKNVGCRVPCYKVDCADNRCMQAITPREVLEVVKKIFATHK